MGADNPLRMRHRMPRRVKAQSWVCYASYSSSLGLIIAGVVARSCCETSFLLRQNLVSLDISNPSRVFQELAGFPGDIRSDLI